MSKYYSGGCCTKGSVVKMADGTSKNIEDLKLNDKIITININDNFIKEEESYVECLLILNSKNGYEYIVELDNNLKISPYHPIYTHSMLKYKWLYPKEISASIPQKIHCDKLYSVLVSNRKPVIINDYICSTLGDNLQENLINHKYFGSKNVIEDLKKFSTYKLGFVNIDKCLLIKDHSNGEVISLVNIPKTFVETLYFANL